MQANDTTPQGSEPKATTCEGEDAAPLEGTAYLNARVVKRMNPTIGNPQSDRHQIVSVSKDGETMTKVEGITKARSRVTTSTPALLNCILPLTIKFSMFLGNAKTIFSLCYVF
ncbi:MAG: hypothetical protein OEX01_06825 [Candidatus Bathyarchaeota archaeon]|nr:hypothetical protein [Candidatus Bathyarchaeota archaeon]